MSLAVIVAFLVPLFYVSISLFLFGSALGVNLIAVFVVLISAAFAFISLTHTLMHIVIEVYEKTVVELNFNIVTKDVKQEDERILLKALIKIKSNNKSIDLKKLYAMNKDLFTKERLTEKLCE